MKKIPIAAVLASAFFCASAARADITIGFSGVMSGPSAALGQDQYDGLMLGIELLGGSLGGQKARVLREDDQLKPEVGNLIVQKFIEKEKVDVIVGLGFSNVLMAESKRIRDSGVVALSTNAGPAPLAGKMCMPNLFVMGWQNDGMSEAMGRYVQEKGYKRAYLMAPNYQAGKDKLGGFKRTYKGEIVDEVYTTLGQPDYSAELSAMQAAKADALFVFYPGGNGINFVQQMRGMGLINKIPVFTDSVIDSTTLVALKKQAVGVVFGANWAPILDNAHNRKFVQAFQAKYKRMPSEYAVSGFDAAYLLDAAVRKSGGKVPDKKAFAAAVKAAGSQFPSVRGKFAFNTNNMPIQNYYAFQVIEQGSGISFKMLSQVLTDHQDAYVGECKS
jgi:branched-chain amino acid transport system substrate-binding protein